MNPPITERASLAFRLYREDISGPKIAAKLGCSRSWARFLVAKGHSLHLQEELTKLVAVNTPILDLPIGYLGPSYRAYSAVANIYPNPTIRDALNAYLLWAPLQPHSLPKNMGGKTLQHLKARLQAARLIPPSIPLSTP